MYGVEFQRSAKRELDALDKRTGDRITLAIAKLQANPRLNARMVAGARKTYRIRVGRYRVVYEIGEPEQLVVVLRVALRTERTYRGF